MTAEDGDLTNSARPDRLRRLERIFPYSQTYFVTACTAKQRPLLAVPEVYQAILRFGRKSPEHGAWIGAFVLMPDHLHLFVALDADVISLSTWMKSLKNAVSKALRLAGIAPPHWQKGFFDHVLRSEESYSEKWEYVRDNPVRAGLVAREDEWPFQGEIYPLEVRRS